MQNQINRFDSGASPGPAEAPYPLKPHSAAHGSESVKCVCSVIARLMGETHPFLPSKTNPWISDGWLILHVWPIFYQAVYSIAIELVFDLVTTVKSVLWCSGYHVCFTRRRSRVRASPEPPFLHVSTLARHYARTSSYTRYLKHPFFGMQLGWQSHTLLLNKINGHSGGCVLRGDLTRYDLDVTLLAVFYQSDASTREETEVGSRDVLPNSTIN